MGSIFFQDKSNLADYEDHALAYYYHLFFILCGLNQTELNVLFSPSLLFFYCICNKNGKKALKDGFESAYHWVKRKLIVSMTVKANSWLETLVDNNYHDKYHLAW